MTVSNFTSPQFQPIAATAEWSGEVFDRVRGKLSLAAGNSLLSLGAELERSASGTNLLLSELTLRTNKAVALGLKAPARLHVVRANNAWSVRLEPFQLAGSAGEIQAQGAVEWPRWGDLHILAQRLNTGLPADFLRQRPDSFDIRKIEANAGWSNGPVVFNAEVSAAGRVQSKVKTAEIIPIAMDIQVNGDQKGIIVSNLLVTSQTSRVAVAHGRLPVSFNPAAGTNMLVFNLDEPLQFQATTQPQAIFWDKLAEWTGVVLRQPNLRLNLAGTWKAPQGVVQLQAEQIQLQKTKAKLPLLEHLELQLQLDREQAKIVDCQLLVQGQPVTLSGEIPLGEKFWAEFKAKNIPSWETARLRLQMQNAELSAFEPLLPNLLSPQGVLNLDISMKPGGEFEGQFSLADARSRPLPNLGSVRDIGLTLKLEGRNIRLENATASIGGSIVTAAGQGDMRGTNWLHGEVPPFEFSLRGTNVPLSRQPESIIRSDLDLTIKKTNGAPSLITGTARLRNSFYLHDIADLIPGKVASPSKRPPYFSIETQPLDNWRLAVSVTGEKFLRVRSTIFSGQASATMKVQGTLKDPVALGDVKIDSGYVRFPFATLDVKQGFVMLTSDDPYRPRINLQAGSKRFGFDVKMDVSGPVDAPILQFSSTPPLSSEQLVLMLTAGEVPRSDFSLSTQQKAQTVGVFVGKDLLAKLGFGGEGEDRLTITSGEEISEQGKETYTVEYKLADRWSLVGEYDRFNAFNAGVKWRVYSK